MTRYKVTEEWGGGEAEDADFASFTPSSEYRALTRDNGRWFALIHEGALTEVPPPIPPEPEPGAYLIGDSWALRTKALLSERWIWHDGAYLHSGTFADLWAHVDGPDVTITPLVPALPDVELPWKLSVGWAAVSVGGSCDAVWVQTVSGGRAVLVEPLSPDAAEAMAAALMTAARAARSKS
jgi:hypothetical protein